MDTSGVANDLTHINYAFGNIHYQTLECFEANKAQGTGPNALDRAMLERIAQGLALDMTAFTAALDRTDVPKEILDDQKVAEDAHIGGTPFLFINDYVASGAQSASRLKRIVRAALAKNP